MNISEVVSPLASYDSEHYPEVDQFQHCHLAQQWVQVRHTSLQNPVICR